MSKKYKILNWAKESEIELLLADGFEDAILGVSRQLNRYSVIYDYEKCLQILIDRDNFTHEDAEEYMQYNVVGAYVGENTPSFLILS